MGTGESSAAAGRRFFGCEAVGGLAGEDALSFSALLLSWDAHALEMCVEDGRLGWNEKGQAPATACFIKGVAGVKQRDMVAVVQLFTFDVWVRATTKAVNSAVRLSGD